MRLTTRSAVAAAAAAALLLGCETAGKRTAIGAGVGAAAGAGVGALVGGWKGAVIGAGVGALAGGSVGLYLDKQAKELEEQKLAEVKRTENGLLVKMKGDVLFDTDSAILKPEAVERLGKMGDILAKYGDDRIRVEGHTDSTGPARPNEELSVRRAGAVREVLVGRGVQPTQITVLGLGETRPVADNGTADGRARNRRVELHIDVPNPT